MLRGSLCSKISALSFLSLFWWNCEINFTAKSWGHIPRKLGLEKSTLDFVLHITCMCYGSSMHVFEYTHYSSRGLDIRHEELHMSIFITRLLTWLLHHIGRSLGSRKIRWLVTCKKRLFFFRAESSSCEQAADQKELCDQNTRKIKTKCNVCTASGGCLILSAKTHSFTWNHANKVVSNQYSKKDLYLKRFDQFEHKGWRSDHLRNASSEYRVSNH